MDATEHHVRSAYDEVADAYANHFPGTEPENPLELAMIRHFVELVHGYEPPPAATQPEAQKRPRVLDAGCGAGRMLPVLSAYDVAVTGIDLSPGMIRRARRDHPDFTTSVGSLTSLPFGNDSFDAVFSWYSTIHNPDADLPVILGELARVCRAGGHVLIAFQVGEGSRDASSGYRRRGYDIELTRHLRTSGHMMRAVADAGMSTAAHLERAAVAGERDPQAVVIARKNERG